MPASRVYMGNTGGSGVSFDSSIVSFINGQANYMLPSSPLSKSSSFNLESGSPLTEGALKDYTIVGNLLTLNLASPLCQTLRTGDTIIGKWAK